MAIRSAHPALLAALAAASTLAALPADTRVYCAHEYTQSCLRFARIVEPDNAAIDARIASVARLRAAGQPSVPATLADELATNPFLRTAEPDARQIAVWQGHQVGGVVLHANRRDVCLKMEGGVFDLDEAPSPRSFVPCLFH